jgi:hypothetical protein
VRYLAVLSRSCWWLSSSSPVRYETAALSNRTARPGRTLRSA